MEMLYFDHNATTPVAPEVIEVMTDALGTAYGNPSSVHRSGQFARQHLEKSRRTVAGSLSASPTEIVFTSGGTEANNLAVLGLVRTIGVDGRHIITTLIEHPCVLEACRQLEREGAEVTYLTPSSDGRVSAEDVSAHLQANTVLVSVMHANNETGSIQSIAEMAEVIKTRRDIGQKIFLHSDGVQAFGKINTAVRDLGVNLYSVSAHKINGPKGVGALFVRSGTPLRGIQFGGRHERERRAGTENVPAIMGFARATELRADTHHVSLLRDRFERRVLDELSDTQLNGSPGDRLPNTSNLLFRGVSAESLVIALDLKGIAVSTGSACSSGSVEPSHVLIAMGRSDKDARASVRFSFGYGNTAADVDALSDAVIQSVRQLRKNKALDRDLVTQ